MAERQLTYAARICEVAASFELNDLGEIGFALAQFVADAADKFAPLGGGNVSPDFERIVSGVDDPSLVERSIASGVSAYLTKPIDTRELEAAIKLAAARHAEFEALEAEVSKAQQALEDDHARACEAA